MGEYHGGYGGGRYGSPPPPANHSASEDNGGIEIGTNAKTDGTNDYRIHENALKDLNQVHGRIKIGVGSRAGVKNVAHIGAFQREEEPRPHPRGPPAMYGVGIGVDFRGPY